MNWSKVAAIFAALILFWLTLAGAWKTYELIMGPEKAAQGTAIEQPDGNSIVSQAKDTSTVKVDFSKRKVQSGGQTLQAYPDGQAMIVSSLTDDNERLRQKLQDVKDSLAAARTYQDSAGIYQRLYQDAQASTPSIIITRSTRTIRGFCFRPGIVVAYGYELGGNRWAWEPSGRLKYLWYKKSTLSCMVSRRAAYPFMPGYHLFRSAEIIGGPGISWDKHLMVKIGLAGDL